MPRPTLVLLPGLLNTRRVFEHQIEALSDVADCIVPELWQHDTIGAMAEARKLGFKIPQSLSITGFDDIELAGQVDPPLTTISVPAGEIGRGAADYLINAISGLSIPKNIQLPYRLIIRGSTAAPPPSRIRKSSHAKAVRSR